MFGIVSTMTSKAVIIAVEVKMVTENSYLGS